MQRYYNNFYGHSVNNAPYAWEEQHWRHSQFFTAFHPFSLIASISVVHPRYPRQIQSQSQPLAVAGYDSLNKASVGQVTLKSNSLHITY